MKPITTFLAFLFVASFLVSNAQAQDARGRFYPKLDHNLEADVLRNESSALDLVIRTGSWPDPAAVLKEAGATRVMPGEGWAEGTGTIATVLQLLADERVTWVQLPDPLLSKAPGNGIALTGAPLLHAAGGQGAGSKVCVIDTEFGQFASAQTNGHIPGGIVTNDQTGLGFTNATDGNHGTSCLKIVHDMAPMATLYAVRVNSTTQLTAAATWAVGQGCQIVSGSIGAPIANFWGPAGSPLHQGIAVLDAAKALAVFAAGNEAERARTGVFVDANGDTYMDWGAEGDSLPAVLVAGAAGAGSRISLTWNAWPATNIDYDLQVIDAANGNVVVQSNNVQNNAAAGGTPPAEVIVSYNPAAPPANPRIRVKIFNLPLGAAHRAVRLEINRGQFALAAQNATSSIGIPACIPSVLAVGALHVENWPNGAIASYSGQGPSLQDPSLTKPEMIAPSNVQDPWYGATVPPQLFDGTSAACPHVAGAAALFLQMEPGLAQVSGGLKSLVMAYASKTGLPAGSFPYVAGFGRVLVPPVKVQNNIGAIEIQPVAPAPNQNCTITIKGGPPGIPFALVATPNTVVPTLIPGVAPVPPGFGAMYISVANLLVLFDGPGFLTQPAPGFPAFDVNGNFAIPLQRPAPLGLHGIVLQAGWLEFPPAGGVILQGTTPLILDF